MLSMVEYVHQRILSYNGEIVVDFTMGNGNDTLTLSRLVTYILDNHKNMEYYLDQFDIGIFNLGYLPKSSSHITTHLSSSQKAITKAIELMNKVLFIVVYPGHTEGKKESEWINQYVAHLDNHAFNVSRFQMLNKNHSPYVIEIEKR